MPGSTVKATPSDSVALPGPPVVVAHVIQHPQPSHTGISARTQHPPTPPSPYHPHHQTPRRTNNRTSAVRSRYSRTNAHRDHDAIHRRRGKKVKNDLRVVQHHRQLARGQVRTSKGSDSNQREAPALTPLIEDSKGALNQKRLSRRRGKALHGGRAHAGANDRLGIQTRDFESLFLPMVIAAL
jgi:hypothetical protein